MDLAMIVEFKEVNEKTWNTALIETEIKGTIFQSTHWAEYLRKTYGDRPIYIASLDNKGNIQGLLLAIESCYAKHPALTLLGKRGLLFGKLYKHTISPVFDKILPFIFWEHGPLILTQNARLMEKSSRKKMLFREIVEKIVEKAQEKNCYEIKLARSAFFDDHGDIFSSLGFWKRRMGTILVNLQEPLDTLWSRINRKARKNIEKLQDDVEIVKASNRNELDEFYKMHLQMSKRAQVKTYPYSYFASLWDHFSKNDMIAVFVAKIKGRPLAGSLSLIFNHTIHDFALADSDYARSMRLYASDVLKWYVMKWGHEKGLKYHNFGGVELYKVDAGDSKAQGIFRYKSKWGGQLIEFMDYGKVFPRRKRLIGILSKRFSDSDVAF